METDAGMAGMNGTGQSSYPGLGSQLPTNEQPVVTINLGLSAKQILAGFGGLSAAIATATTAGWLFLPAKNSDLQAVKAVVEIVRSEQQTSRDAVARLTVAVDNLAAVVEGLRQAPPRVIERTRVIKQPPKTP